MLRDVFYFGNKPNVHPRERHAKDLDHARSLCTTDHFWIINEFCIYTEFEWDFDFEFLPDEDVWTEDHNNVWPSTHQKDSGTWLCTKEESKLIIYRNDVVPLKRKNIKTDNWVVLDTIDESKFDFGWHPDPSDPPYIYKWGNKFYPVEIGAVLEYHVPGATQIKYMKETIELLPQQDRWVVVQDVDKDKFDFTWRPDPREPAFIYVWGNKFYPVELDAALEYHAPGATQVKYMTATLELLPDWSRWEIPPSIDKSSFDFTWRPDPREPALIYQFGTQWQKTGGPRYTMPDATETKYIDTAKATILPDRSKWIIPEHIDVSDFDFSWHPDDTAPAYIYQFGTQWSKQGGPMYLVEGATHIQYVEHMKATALANMSKWFVPEGLDVSEFDFSWHPDVDDQPYIYMFGTQWQKTSGPRYIEPGARVVKYVSDSKAIACATTKNWYVHDNIKINSFDFSWHPDETEQPYIYVFGNQYYTGEIMPTIEYRVPGATTVKYIHDIVATITNSRDNWIIPNNIAYDGKFDFNWIPNPNDPPYIYEFGTQWQKNGGVQYVVPGATEIKYMDTKVTVLPTNTVQSVNNWKVLPNIKIDETRFDFSWHPDNTEPPYIYIFGNQWNSAEIEPTVEYHVPNATEKKYVSDIVVHIEPDMEHWVIPDNIDKNKFDFSWRPNPKDPPYIYVFGNQHYPGEKMPTLLYKVEGATEYKYVSDITATLLPTMDNWKEVLPINKDKFDFSWCPDPNDPPYIYVFGNQWNSAEIESTLEYHVSGASERKYISNIIAYVLPDMEHWDIPDNIDKEKFDFSWRPDPGSPPYIYEFATEWNNRGGPKYIVPTSTDYKYIEDIKAKLLPNKNNWIIPEGINVDDFDFSWVPHPEAPSYIYQFGTLQDDNDGPIYQPNNNNGEIVKLPRVYKVKEQSIEVLQYYIKTTLEDLVKEHTDEVFWAIRENIDYSNFDFEWRPEVINVSWESDYVHVFGSPEAEITQTYFINAKSYLKGKRDLKYVEPDKKADLPTQFKKIHGWLDQENNEIDRIVTALYADTLPQYSIKTTLQDLVQEHPHEAFWAVRDNINYIKFDFNWRPEVENAIYVQVFGSPDSELTQTYLVSADIYNLGYTNFNFIESDKRADDEYLTSLFKPNDMFFVDRGNYEAKERFESLKQQYPNIQKTRFLNTWVDTINRCINRSNTELCWILNSEYDYTNFNFNYYPNQWQMKMVHVFGTQWNQWGTTFVVNRNTFSEDTKYIKIIEHLNNINIVKDRKALATNNLYDIWLIDHGNDLSEVKKTLEAKSCGKGINIIPYDNSYLQTFKNLVKKIPDKKEDYIWLCSSICDYNDFDFSYTVDPFSKDNLHIFPSDQQKFGDTFFVDVNKTKEVIDTIDKLQAYPKANYNNRLNAKRLPAPIFNTNNDTHVGSLNIEYDFPYAVFQTEPVDVIDQEPISLWSDDMKNIVVTSTGGTRIIVPKEAKEIVKNELYDYPYIKTASKLGSSKPIDIVFLSNGEQCADENYRHLLAVTKHTKNRVVRVDGVDGRVQAYHAAVEASETPWAFTVFAKLKVNNKFDWGWQPDRMQIPKHYIFHAKNPVNGLEYGHQGMIAYNKKLTLANQGKGLDFTLDDPHETVKLLSGVATFNTDPYSTWRTAFREVVKLQSDYSDIAAERLKVWTEIATGDYAEYCLQGAKDAVEFYDSVMGDIDELKKSYEWDWLKEFYRKKYR